MLFSAVKHAGGSGWARKFALVRPGEKFVDNLFPSNIVLTEQSEISFWTVPAISPYPVLVVADYVWGPDETHFAPHRFIVNAFVLAGVELEQYYLQDQYLTAMSYPSLDSGEGINVLSHERAEILARLKRVKSAREQKRRQSR